MKKEAAGKKTNRRERVRELPAPPAEIRFHLEFGICVTNFF